MATPLNDKSDFTDGGAGGISQPVAYSSSYYTIGLIAAWVQCMVK